MPCIANIPGFIILKPPPPHEVLEVSLEVGSPEQALTLQHP